MHPYGQNQRPIALAAPGVRDLGEQSPSKSGRAQESRMLVAPRGLVCSVENTRVRNHRFNRSDRPSLRDWFTAYGALSPESGLNSLRRQPLVSGRLDPSVGRSGPRTFAVRFRRVRQLRRQRPSHPAPTFVTTRTPLLRVRDGGEIHLILTSEKEKYFSSSFLTRPNGLKALAKSVFRRRRS
jgi:hypothetical protein